MQKQPRLFSNDLRLVLEQAQNEAARRHGNYLDVEHLLLGVLRQPSGPAQRILSESGVNSAALYDQVAREVGVERPLPAPVKDLSRSARSALDRAAQEADALGQSTLSSGHLLLSLLAEPAGAVHDALSRTPLQPDSVRALLRAQGDQPSTRPPGAPPAGPSRRAAPSAAPGEPDVVVPFRPARAKEKPKTPSRWGNWPLILAAIAVFVALLVTQLPGRDILTFVLVLIGWVFSVTLHEFAHALVAYHGGDYTVKDKGYLSFNPLKYAHPMLSIGMPLLFLALGGIGLPGGAVYIERHRLKSKWWGAAVSAAGPAANLLLALLLAAPFALGLVDVDLIRADINGWYVPPAENIWQQTTLWSAVAFLAMLQITAVIFNLLPIPPLDGFGVIEPLLDERTRWQLRQFGAYGLLLIFIILWTPLGNSFWQMIFELCRDLHIPTTLIAEGFRSFMFWRQPPQ